ncbi:unnamed protein product [Timema podura]|uniref:EGF-like domain-containing protein n=1 Tax=Timema podura TaxID=61482 RepID=A0ABN7NRN6_TIMPD|nr:unnamed protein product [Timema podura]
MSFSDRSACNHHGTCTLEDGEYHCVCSDGWAGLDCSIRLELECDDDIDNDEDGMTDCSDSECCNHHSCTEHIMCHASNDPVEVLLRKQPPSVTASFYQRVKFLIEENSVQSYAHMDEYSESLKDVCEDPGFLSLPTVTTHFLKKFLFDYLGVRHPFSHSANI